MLWRGVTELYDGIIQKKNLLFFAGQICQQNRYLCTKIMPSYWLGNLIPVLYNIVHKTK